MSDGAGRPVAVVTGASRGLGAVVARYLAGERYRLVLSAQHDPGLRAVESALRPFDPEVDLVPGDLRTPEIRARLAGRVEELGRLDLLVNNAAILGATPLPPLEGYSLGRFEEVLAVNLIAPLALTQILLPWLVRAHGQVINVSSDAAVGGYPGWGAYGASKAALDLVSLTLAHELASRGVSVVAVDPGDMRTPGVEAALAGEDLSSRPSPEVTLPFWAWLLHQDRGEVSGHRFQAQAERWEVPA
jgi:NAD(P)-dependent dehydrogenase (short-subunit alcohol dehydrogenase family)